MLDFPLYFQIHSILTASKGAIMEKRVKSNIYVLIGKVSLIPFQ